MKHLIWAAAVLTVAAADAGRASAFWPLAPAGFNPTTGRIVATPARNPITLAPTTAPMFSPVVGSVTRHSRLVNPFTHRAKYRGQALDPATGLIGSYKFRQ